MARADTFNNKKTNSSLTHKIKSHVGVKFLWKSHIKERLQQFLNATTRDTERSNKFVLATSLILYWKLASYSSVHLHKEGKPSERKGPFAYFFTLFLNIFNPEFLYGGSFLPTYPSILLGISVGYLGLALSFAALLDFLLRCKRKSYLILIFQSLSKAHLHLFFFPLLDVFLITFTCNQQTLTFLERGFLDSNKSCKAEEFTALQGLAFPLLFWNLLMVLVINKKQNGVLGNKNNDSLAKYSYTFENSLLIGGSLKAIFKILLVPSTQRLWPEVLNLFVLLIFLYGSIKLFQAIG